MPPIRTGPPPRPSRVAPTRPLSLIPAALTRPERRLPDLHEDPQDPGPPNRKWKALVGCLILVFAVLAAYDVESNHGTLLGRPLASRTVSHQVTHKPSPRPRARLSSAADRTPRASHAASASPSASPSRTLGQVRELSARSVAAFGPDGTSDGDNPATASRVLTGDGVDGWSSLWYRSAEFGNLQSGTGLLLDMGKDVSVSSVRVVLGNSVGADLQVRLGDSARDPSDLSSAFESASGVAGTVRLSMSSPVRARYVLIWFTRLPPDDAGTYQIFVYSVTVSGRS